MAGDFATVGAFDYTYDPAPGAAALVAAAPSRASQRFTAAAAMPADLVENAAATETGPEVFAEVPVDPQGRQQGKIFHVLINPPAGIDPTDESDPHHATSLVFFGRGHGHEHGPTKFLVALSPALRKLEAAGQLKDGEPIQLFVAVEDTVAKTKGPAQPVEAAILVE